MLLVFLVYLWFIFFFFFFLKEEDGIRFLTVTGVQTCALPISRAPPLAPAFSMLLRARLRSATRSQETPPAESLRLQSFPAYRTSTGAIRSQFGRASRTMLDTHSLSRAFPGNVQPAASS